MTSRRRLHRTLVVAAAAGFCSLLLWPQAASARQTPTPTTTPVTSAVPTTTATTVRPTTTTAGRATTTTVAKPDEGRFNVAPRSGNPGVTIRITDVVPKCPAAPGKTVLVAIGMGSGRAYGSHIIATASTAADGSWGGTVVVPRVPSGTYEMYASCFVQHPGQYDDEMLLPYSGPTFAVTNSSVAATSTTSISADSASSSKKNDDSLWLVVGIVVAGVLALAALIYAFVMRSRVSHGTPKT